jgi:hypothetical protein
MPTLTAANLGNQLRAEVALIADHPFKGVIARKGAGKGIRFAGRQVSGDFAVQNMSIAVHLCFVHRCAKSNCPRRFAALLTHSSTISKLYLAKLVGRLRLIRRLQETCRFPLRHRPKSDLFVRSDDHAEPELSQASSASQSGAGGIVTPLAILPKAVQICIR